MSAFRPDPELRDSLNERNRLTKLTQGLAIDAVLKTILIALIRAVFK